MLDLPHRTRFAGHSIAWGSIGEGKPLVLVHGTPFSSQVWRRIAPWLARDRKVFFFDLLGYGQSAMPDADVSLGVQNRLLGALLREWGIEKPAVLAHDFGGATALRAHFIDGVEYSRLTLVDPVCMTPQGSPFVAHVGHHEAAFSGLPAYAHDALVTAYLRDATARPLSEEALGIYKTPWVGEDGQAAFYRQIAQMDQKYVAEAEKRYERTAFPISILWGEEDKWVPLDHGRALARRLTDGSITIVPNAGHLMQEDAPEAILATMLQDRQENEL